MTSRLTSREQVLDRARAELDDELERDRKRFAATQETPLINAARKVAQAQLAAREAGEAEIADELGAIQDRLAKKVRDS